MGYRKRDTQDLCSPYHQLETQTNNWNQALQKYCFEVWTPILWTRLKRGRWVTDLFLRKLCLIEQVMKYMDFRTRKPKVVDCITSSSAKERQNKVSSFPAFRSLLKKPPWPRELSCLSWGSRNLSFGKFSRWPLCQNGATSSRCSHPVCYTSRLDWEATKRAGYIENAGCKRSPD